MASERKARLPPLMKSRQNELRCENNKHTQTHTHSLSLFLSSTHLLSRPIAKCSTSLESTGWTRPESALLIGHVNHLHIIDRILMTNPSLGFAILNPVHEFL